jgi:UrcA family protein
MMTRFIGATTAIATVAIAVLTHPTPALAAGPEARFAFAYERGEVQTPIGKRALAERLRRESRRYCAAHETSPVMQMGCRRILVRAVEGAIAERAAGLSQRVA